MYTNADGICSKLPEFKDRIQTINPDIICITETKLESIITNEALGLVTLTHSNKEDYQKFGKKQTLPLSTRKGTKATL